MRGVDLIFAIFRKTGILLESTLFSLYKMFFTKQPKLLLKQVADATNHHENGNFQFKAPGHIVSLRHIP